MQNLRKVWDAGITVVMGTDAGNIGTLHGPSVFREMALMHAAGLTPLQVLRSATVERREGDGHGARARGRSRPAARRPGDPRCRSARRHRAISPRVYRTIKNGVVYDPDKLMPPAN